MITIGLALRLIIGVEERLTNQYRNDFEKYSADFDIKKDWVFPYAEIEKGSKIILYGAGDVGQSYFFQLSQNGYCEVVHWVDMNFLRYKSFGLNVEAVETIVGSDYDYVVIAVFDSLKAREINQSLISLGVEQNKIIWNSVSRYVYRGYLEEKRLIEPAIEAAKKVLQQRSIATDCGQGKEYIDIIRDKARRGFVIPRLVVELTTACTLKCKHCNNLIPHLRPRNIDLEKVISDISCILDAVDSIIVMEVIGGEPLLYPHIKEVLEFILASDKIFGIEVTTNGTIIPDCDLIELLKNPKATVHVSCYEASNKKHELERMLFDNGISYICMNELSWINPGGIESRHRSEEQLKNEYWNCYSSYACKILFDGKVFSCARSASLYELGILSDSGGYVEVYNRESLRDELKSFWLKLYDEACNYCDIGDSWRIIKAGEQL